MLKQLATGMTWIQQEGVAAMKYLTLIVMTILAGAVALGGMGNQLGVYQQELESLRGQVAALEAERGRLQVTLTQLEAALGRLQQERDALADHNTLLETEIARLRQTLEMAQRRIEPLQTQISELREEATRRRQTLEWLGSLGSPPIGLSVVGMSAMTMVAALVLRTWRRRMSSADTSQEAGTTIWVRMTRDQARRYARHRCRQ
jgi:predicted RNase H-like nuclease (RuvC/YqgF family)